MKSYRLLFLDQRGRLLDTCSIDCLEEQEAVAIAKRGVRHFRYVEVWDGGHPIGIYAAPARRSIRPGTLLRRWRRPARTAPV